MYQKRFIKIIALLFLLVTSALFFTTAVTRADVNDFTISKFEADYYLTKDSTNAAQLKTVETITAEFPDFDQNHGILRAIPEKYLDKNLHLKIISVADSSGKSLNYTTSTDNDNLVLKIGDKNVYVHSSQTYVITYTSNNVVRFFDTHDEWYWNVNGTQWQQPVSLLTARIHIPNNLATALKTDKVCYTGVEGSKDSNCNWAVTQTGSETLLTLTTTKELSAGETATFVLAFNKGTFSPIPMTFWEKHGHAIGLSCGIAGILLIPIVTFIILFKKWWKYGRDPKGRGTIIPEYQAPKDLSVLGSSAIYSESVATNAFSAQIVDLAIKGYIRIEETVKDKLIGKLQQYSLSLLKLADNKLSDEEKSLLEGIFTGQPVGSNIPMTDLKNKFYKQVSEISKSLMDGLTTKGYFVKNPQKVKIIYIIAGIAMIMFGFFTLIFLIGIGLIMAGILCLIFAAIMPARTQQGLDSKEYLEGLKLYIGTAEKDRFEYLQSVKGAERVTIAAGDNVTKVKLFEDLLPYAMLFKMEKSWAKQFDGIYSQPPDWYNGNWATFNMVYLASSLGSFNTAASTSFAAPSSSSGSGFGGGGW